MKNILCNWKICISFASAIERDSGNKWWTNGEFLLNLQSVGILKIPKAEEKNKKTSEKIWKIKIKVLTFATAIKNNDSD